MYFYLNVLADSPIYSSSESSLLHLYHYIILLLHCIGSLSFGNKHMFLIVLLPLKYVLMPSFPHMPLNTFARPCTYGMTVFLVFVVVVAVAVVVNAIVASVFGLILLKILSFYPVKSPS